MTTKITVLGNFSGRNAGDNAILGNLVRDVAKEIPDAEFLVPTLNKAAVRNICRGFNVRPMGLMPWHGALKIFGIATLRAMINTECVLITDNILFDKKLFNPVFNYLSTIALFAPLSRRRRIPVVLYNASVGPVTTSAGASALRRVLRGSPVAILRDRASTDLIARIVDPSPEMILAADCALGTEVPSQEALSALAKKLAIVRDDRPCLGLNVNVYVDAWKGDGGSMSSSSFVTRVASAFDALVEEFGAQPVFFITQKMDYRITEAVRSSMKHGATAPLVQITDDCNYREIAGLLGMMDLLVAMRTHALILATSVFTPAVNLNTYPKSAAYMETIGQEGWNLDISDFTVPALTDLVRTAWASRPAIRAQLEARVTGEKVKAAASARLVRDLLKSREAVPAARLLGTP